MADAKMITITIDGTPLQVPDGTYVWDACRKIGIEVVRCSERILVAPSRLGRLPQDRH